MIFLKTPFQGKNTHTHTHKHTYACFGAAIFFRAVLGMLHSMLSAALAWLSFHSCFLVMCALEAQVVGLALLQGRVPSSWLWPAAVPAGG